MSCLRLLGAAVSTSLSALVLTPTAYATSASVETFETTVHFDYVGNAAPCVDEPIHIVGDVTSRIRITTTPTGQSLGGGHTTADMTGEGLTSGTTYTIRDSRQITVNVLQRDPFEVVDIGAWTFMFISPGGTDNLVLTAQHHVTMTSDGDPAVSFSHFDLRCVG